MSTSSDTPPPAKEDTTIALLAYITPILFGVGIVIAIVMHNGKKTALGAYHLRQALGLLLTGVALMVPYALPLVNVVWFFLSPLISIALFVLWIMGLLNAINGVQKPIPLVGEYYKKWFAAPLSEAERGFHPAARLRAAFLCPRPGEQTFRLRRGRGCQG
jgi:uncharacterized membrane protein